MKIFLLSFAILVTAAFAAKCPEPTNVQAKQQLLDNLVSYINKPCNKPAPVPPMDPIKMKGIGKLPKWQVFSLFDERSWPEVIEVLKRMMAAPTFEDFIKVCETLYPRVNEDLLLYALSVAIVHRPDAQGVHLPRVHDVYPDKFIPDKELNQLRKLAIEGHQEPKINFSLDVDHFQNPYSKVQYFTEDVGMNSNHYHWHVLHPSIWKAEFGERKDRMGELFYWMHRQMVARFDNELLSNHLSRIEPLDDWDKKVECGFAPHLTIQRTGYHYMIRPDDLEIENLPKITKDEMKRWYARICAAIESHNVTLPNGEVHKLTEKDGMDTLGHLIASTVQSKNRQYYGNLHSYAHIIAGRMADSEGNHMEDHGAMYDVATSARDPFFYMWHKYIDKLFSKYQKTLTPYTADELTWDDVTINDVHVENCDTKEENLVHTYFTTTPMKLGKGFEFTKNTPATIKVEHLDHDDFYLVMDVTNHASQEKTAIFRVFMAPKLDEHGLALSLKEQRPIMIEIDKFKYKLSPGKNVVRRCSNESSVTISTDHIFGDQKTIEDDDHCHCGWPEYLLVPKGDHDGMHYELFVMATDLEEDRAPETEKACHCSEALSYCGAIYGDNPDKRPMGYPFDRKLSATSWEEFKTHNMEDADIVIKFSNEHRDHKHHDHH